MGHLRYTALDEVEYETGKPLFSNGLLTVLFLLVIAVLIALFPGNSLINMLINQNYISEVDYRYTILLSSNTNPITYAKINENPSEVVNQLATGFKDQNTQSIWFNYIILKTILYKAATSKQLKRDAIKVMRQYLTAFQSIPITFKQDIELAEDALTINQSSTALFFYEQAIMKDPDQTKYFYAKVAKTALWAKQCVKSSKYYFNAQDRSALITDKRYFFIMALRVLFQCNQFELAIKSAEQHIDGLSEDPLTYQLLTELAIKANEPSNAMKFVLKLLQLQSDQKKR